jgi:hypothetical protein
VYVSDVTRRERCPTASPIRALTTALEAEAIPVSDDPSTTLVSRQEVELALRTTDDPAVTTMMKLAARGGDIAACVASEWGRMTLKAAAGDDTNHKLIRDEAIRTAATGEDEERRRAAAALQALTNPRPGDRPSGKALSEAQVKLAVFVLGVGDKLARTMPIIP